MDVPSSSHLGVSGIDKILQRSERIRTDVERVIRSLDYCPSPCETSLISAELCKLIYICTYGGRAALLKSLMRFCDSILALYLFPASS